MIDKLDLDCVRKNLYKVGVLNAEIIKLLNLDMTETDIYIWKDRIKYIEKHKKDFQTEQEYKKHVEAIPEIINDPDYVGLHPKGNSIQYIKKIDKYMLVAVRLKLSNKLAVRSSYPITKEKLDWYLKCGTVLKAPKNLDI